MGQLCLDTVWRDEQKILRYGEIVDYYIDFDINVAIHYDSGNVDFQFLRIYVR